MLAVEQKSWTAWVLDVFAESWTKAQQQTYTLDKLLGGKNNPKFVEVTSHWLSVTWYLKQVWSQAWHILLGNLHICGYKCHGMFQRGFPIVIYFCLSAIAGLEVSKFIGHIRGINSVYQFPGLIFVGNFTKVSLPVLKTS